MLMEETAMMIKEIMAMAVTMMRVIVVIPDEVRRIILILMLIMR